jgi:hypothetical protein
MYNRRLGLVLSRFISVTELLHPSVSLPVYLTIFLYISLFLCLYVSQYFSTSFCSSIFLYRSNCPYTFASVRLIHLHVCPCISISICLFECLCIYCSTSPSICLSVCTSVRLSLYFYISMSACTCTSFLVWFPLPPHASICLYFCPYTSKTVHPFVYGCLYIQLSISTCQYQQNSLEHIMM